MEVNQIKNNKEENINLKNKTILALLPEAYAPFDPLVDGVHKKKFEI